MGNREIEQQKRAILEQYGGAVASDIENRNQELGDSTKKAAQKLLLDCGESVAARFLSAHDALNSIVHCADLSDPKERAAYMNAVSQAFEVLASSLGGGYDEIIGSGVNERQRNIAEHGDDLSKKIRDAVKDIGGSVGPLPHYAPNNIGNGLFRGPRGPRKSRL